jgi:membrane-associated phospholipid phosphatase
MAFWGLAASVYGVVMAVAALTQPIQRRTFALTAAVAYSLVSAGAATLTSLWVNLLAPGALLLAGYWLSGLFFRAPQPWLEGWLLRTDRALLADQWMARLPRAVGELLEGSYATVHVVVGGAAIFAATAGVEAVTYYWDLVLTAALASYAPLPWLRSRPPRVLDHSVATPRQATAAPRLRRLNVLILDHASVHANTLPSGHVSSAVAAALGVMAVNPAIGWILLVVAFTIGVAAVAGRYHYAVDCVAGAAVAFLVFVAL